MASPHWLTQINCYDNMITGENWAVSHIIRSLWDNARGRWRSEKKFPSKRGGTIAESCQCQAWQLHRWAKYVLSHPPLCSRVITLHTTRCPWGRAYHSFCSAVWKHNAGLKEQDRDKDCHNWTLSLEPGTSCWHTGSYSSFILMAKDVWFVWGRENGFYSALSLWNTCFWGKLFCVCTFFHILTCFLPLGPTFPPTFSVKFLFLFTALSVSYSLFFASCMLRKTGPKARSGSRK